MIEIIVNLNVIYDNITLKVLDKDSKFSLISDSYWILQELKCSGLERSFKEEYQNEIEKINKSFWALVFHKNYYFPVDLSDQSVTYLIIRRINKNFTNVYFKTYLNIEGHSTTFRFDEEYEPISGDYVILDSFVCDSFRIDLKFI